MINKLIFNNSSHSRSPTNSYTPNSQPPTAHNHRAGPTTQLHRASNSNMSNIHLSSSLLNDSTQAPTAPLGNRMNANAPGAGLTLGKGLLYRADISVTQRPKQARKKKTSPLTRITHTQSSITQKANA